MTTFFPHPAYAEDQPYSHTILTGHVLSRGFLMGSVLALPTATISTLISHFRSTPIAKSIPLSTLFTKRLLTYTARGSLIGTALVSIGLWGKMNKKEEIEWKDRAWRLIENEGQRTQDNWLGGGVVAGTVVALVAGRRGWMPRGSAGVFGGAGLGSVVGTIAWAGARIGTKKEEGKDEVKDLGEKVKESVRKMG